MAIRSGLAATAAAAVLALALGGCGGDSEQPTSSGANVAASPPAESTTPATPPATTTAEPSAKPKPKSTSQAQSTEPEPSPSPSPELTTNAPVGPALICLRAAGLRDPQKRGNGIWSGSKPGGRPVFVDGPYESLAEARASASSLDGVTADAVAGGIYVASSGLRSKLRRTVSEVADCLERRSR